MKVAKAIFFIGLTVLLAACQENGAPKNPVLSQIKDTAKGNNHSKKVTYALQGEWQLLEKLVESGNYKRIWIKRKGTDYEFLTFSSYGDVSGTVFPEYVNYSVIDSSTLVLKTEDELVRKYIYVIKIDTLEIFPVESNISKGVYGLRFISALD